MQDRKPDRRLLILAVFVVLAAAVVAVILISRNSGGGSSGDSISKHCKESPVGAPHQLNLNCPNVGPPPKGSVAVFETSKGKFTVALDSTNSPYTTASFKYLVENQLYTKTKFHRVVRGFVIQGGDPLGTGAGGPGYSVTEPPPPGTQYIRGVVAMAKTGADPPGTSGSQFFVVTAPNANLPPEYALLGRVIDGMNVVDRIDRLGTPAETPREPVWLNQVQIAKK